jgi:hypothetical protein
MVKLTEVEDEHFTEKPIPSKHDALLVSDDEEDYTDTGKCWTKSHFFGPFSRPECAFCIALGLLHQSIFENIQFESTYPKPGPLHPTGPEPRLRKDIPGILRLNTIITNPSNKI